MVGKNFLAILFVSQLLTMEAQSSSVMEIDKNETAVDQSKLITGAIDSTVDAIKANDYLCGSLVVQVSDNWKITSVKVKQGSIQNQFQFKKHPSDSELYVPSGLGDNFFHIRQSTGYLRGSRLYVASYPIDFVITLAQEGQFNEMSYRVTKGTCNALQVGGVEVAHVEGNAVDYVLKNSERDDSTWIIHGLSSRYFTPAYLLIPAPFYDYLGQ